MAGTGLPHILLIALLNRCWIRCELTRSEPGRKSNQELVL